MRSMMHDHDHAVLHVPVGAVRHVTAASVGESQASTLPSQSTSQCTHWDESSVTTPPALHNPRHQVCASANMIGTI
jgi:hypothetical protein